MDTRLIGNNNWKKASSMWTEIIFKQAIEVKEEC